MDEGAECQAIVPACGEVCHGDLIRIRIILGTLAVLGTHRVVPDPVLDPHEDHLLGAGAAPGGQTRPGPGPRLLLVHHLDGEGGARRGGRHAQVPVEGGAPLPWQRRGPVIRERWEY